MIPTQAPFILAMFAVCFYLHTRLSMVPLMISGKGRLKTAWRATRGHFFRLAPITIVKWGLVLAPPIIVILFDIIAAATGSDVVIQIPNWAGILAMIVAIPAWSFFGLVNHRLHEALVPPSNTDSEIPAEPPLSPAFR